MNVYVFEGGLKEYVCVTMRADSILQVYEDFVSK